MAELYVVFNKTDSGYKKPFHSIEQTEESAIATVELLQKSIPERLVKARSLIYYRPYLFGEQYYE